MTVGFEGAFVGADVPIGPWREQAPALQRCVMAARQGEGELAAKQTREAGLGHAAPYGKMI